MDNRRHTIVINKKFQYQYALLLVVLAVLLVNAFLILRIVAPGEAPALPSGLVTRIALVELFLVAGIWYASLKASHRIAGPVYVFNREIRRLGAGDLGAEIHLREKDMFREEAAEMNASIAALRDRIGGIQSLARQLGDTHAAGGDTGALIGELNSALDGFATDKTDKTTDKKTEKTP